MIPNFKSEFKNGAQTLRDDFRRDWTLLVRALPKRWLGVFITAIIGGALLPILAIHIVSGVVDAWIGARGLGAATSRVYGLPLLAVVLVAAIIAAQIFAQYFEGKLRAVAVRRTLQVSLLALSIDLLVLGWWIVALLGALTGLIFAARRLSRVWNVVAAFPLLIALFVASGQVIRFVVSRAITVGQGLLTYSIISLLLLVIARQIYLLMSDGE